MLASLRFLPRKGPEGVGSSLRSVSLRLGDLLGNCQ